MFTLLWKGLPTHYRGGGGGGFFPHWSEGKALHWLEGQPLFPPQFPTVFALLCPRASRGLRVDTIIFFYFFFSGVQS